MSREINRQRCPETQHRWLPACLHKITTDGTLGQHRKLRGTVDVDTFIARHSADWQRLDELAGRRRLDGAEADELVALYRQVATHLSLVQTRAPDPLLTARLSRLLARARAATVGTPRVRGW